MNLRFKSRFQAIMWCVSGIALLCFAVAQILYSRLGLEFLSVFRTTALTVFYHLAVRLVFGEWLVRGIRFEGVDYSRGWFRVRAWEMALYRRMGVQRWKGGMPTYNPEEFSMAGRSIEEIVRSTCRAEIVHEFNVIVSFLPLLFSIPFGAFMAFLLTSIAAAVFDMVFVIMQRYNRPRLIRLMQMRERRQK